MNTIGTKLSKSDMGRIGEYLVINQEAEWISVFWMRLRKKGMKIVTVITVGKLMSNSFRYSKIVTVQKIGIILDTKSNSLVESGKMTTIIMNQTFSNLITRRNLRILKLRPNLTNMITFSLSFRKIIVFISLLILYSKSHCRIMRRLI